MVGLHAAGGNGLMAELRQVLVDRPMCQYREHVARTRAEQLDRIIWAEEARSEHPYRGRDSRDARAAPIRWPRLI